jgi:peptidoglycan/LPS O-acetylase OafA/YrhL
MGALRLLLAFSVVLNHTHGLFRVQLAGGVLAVELFFMISGFVMAMVLTEKYDPAKDRKLFYSNRLLRIFVPYAVVLVFAAVIALITFFNGRTGPFALIAQNAPSPVVLAGLVVTQITIVGQELFLFLQHGTGGGLVLSGAKPDMSVVGMLLAPPAWSISLELLFYSVAPFIIRLRTRYVILLALMSVALRIGFWLAGMRDDPWSYRFLPLEMVFFLAGIVAYRIFKAKLVAPRFAPWLGAGLVACVFAFQPARLVVEHFGFRQELVMWPICLYAVIALPALFAWTSRNRIDRFLGNFSYAVYLVHWPLISLYDGLFQRTNPNIKTAVILATSMAAAYAITELVEKPLDQYRQRRFDRETSR